MDAGTFRASEPGLSRRKASPALAGKAPNVLHRFLRLRHVAGEQDDIRLLVVQMLERGSGRNPVSREMHVRYLGHAQPIETRGQPRDANLVTAQHHPMGLEAEGIGSHSRPGRADAGQKSSTGEFHPGKLVGFPGEAPDCGHGSHQGYSGRVRSSSPYQRLGRVALRPRFCCCSQT